MVVGQGWDIPEGVKPWQNFHWFAPSAKQCLILIILSGEPTWYAGHFVAGRMAPCVGPGCDYCAAAIGAQVRYCFAVVEPITRRVGLVEFGEGNGQMIRDWGNRNRGIRGMRIEVSKHSRAAQSRTEIRYCDEVPPMWIADINAPDPALALYLTWNKAGMRMPAAFAERMAAEVQTMQLDTRERRRFVHSQGKT